MSKKSKTDSRENNGGMSVNDLPARKSNSKSSAVEASHTDLSSDNKTAKTGVFSYLKSHLWLVAVIAFLALGTLGAGLKYLDDEAQREIALRNSQKGKLNNQSQSFLNSVNPFLPPPDPTPTPQLSKEYIYAGSRLLAVEDAGANVAPPADLAIWRPTSGEWWVMKPDGNVQATVGWGVNGDDPVEGDYDGDGKTDFAVYRPATASTSGTWWIMRSSDNSYFSTPLGGINDLPAPADYDGDGKTDAAVFRPSTGTWYILQSSTSQTAQGQFGMNGDKPAPADYDGDGKADIAVWRNSATAFYSLNSSDNQVQLPTFGQDGDEVVSGDYDGDGKADYAIYKYSTAIWYIRRSTTGQIATLQWGAGNNPVQNDYDGDGKVDLATWQNGTWTIKNSADNSTRTVQWGAAGDIPVPAYYRR